MEMQEPIKDFRDLVVWKKSMDLVTDIYRVTEQFPRSEQFGLTNQIRRAAVSIPSNIAEGNARGSRKEYKQFVVIAYGSSAEVLTQLEIAQRLQFGNGYELKVFKERIVEVQKMLYTLKSKL